MAWLARGDFTGSDFIQATDLNNLHADDVTWGGNVNGGGYTLSNVILAGVTTQGGTAGVSSFNTRTGAVVSQGGDYTAAMVGAVPTTLQILTPAGSGLSGGGPLTGNLSLSAAIVSFNTRVGAITLTPADITSAMGVVQARAINSGAGLQGGGNLSADRTLSVIPGDPTQQIQFLQGGTVVATRHAINFISGANVTVAVADNSGSGRVDVTVSSTGGGSGMVDPTTAKGDLIVRGPSITSKLAVGTDGQVLTADSTQSLGVKWGAASGGGTVATVFGRTGPAIVAAGGDYTAAQVTNAVDKSQTYSDPMWLTGLNWSKILSAPVILADPTTTKGDLLVRTSSLLTRLPVGGDGTILVADSAQSSGVRWGASPSAIPAGQFSGDMLLWKQTGGWGLISAAGQPAAVGNVLTVQSIGASTTLAWQAPPPPQATTYSVNGTQISAGTFGLNVVAGNNTAITGAIDSGNLRTTITITAGGPTSGLADPTTTKGDLIARATAQVTRLPIGTDGTILMADSTQALGMKWAAVSGGGGGGAQTPWTSNIDAAGYTLSNVPVIQAPTPSGAAANLILNAPGTLGSVSLQVDGTTMAAVNENGLTSWGAITAGVNALFPGGPPMVIIAGLSSSTWHITGTASPTTPGTNVLTFQCMNQNAGVYCMNDLGYFGAGVAHPFYNLDAAGDCNITGVYRIAGNQLAAAQVVNAVSTLGSYANPAWITSLAYSKITGAPTAASLQTPWTQNIDAATFNLTNVGKLAIGTATPQWIVTVAGPQPKTTSSNFLQAWMSNDPIASNPLSLTLSLTGGATAATRNAMLQVTEWGTGSVYPPLLLQNSGGSVGIANTTPTQVLTVGSFNPATDMGIAVCGVVGTGSRLTMLYAAATNGIRQNVTDAQIVVDQPGNLLLSSRTNNGSGISFWTTPTSGSASLQRLTITPAGNVSIGTGGPVPTYPLHVHVATDLNAVFASAGGAMVLSMCKDDIATSVPVQYYANPHAFLGGSVGIGMTGPTAQLHVQGAGQASPVINTTATPLGGGIYVHDSGPAGNNGGFVLFGAAQGSFAAIKGALQNGAGNSQGDLVFSTRRAAADAALTEAMRVTLGGNVGIGTTAPLSLLDVHGPTGGSYGSLGTLLNLQSTISNPVGLQLTCSGQAGMANWAICTNQVVAGDLHFKVSATPTTAPATAILALEANGSVGIGTTAPADRLTVINTSLGPAALPANGLAYFCGSVAVGLEIGSYPGSPYGNWLQSLHLSAAGNYYPIVLNPLGGNVGIGNSNPQTALHVFGDGTFSRGGGAIGAIYFGNSGGVYLVWDGSAWTLTGGPLSLNTGSLTVANGNVNINGQYLVNGVPMPTVGGPTTFTLPGKTINTVYQNTTGKMLYVAAAVNVPPNSNIAGMVGTVNPPQWPGALSSNTSASNTGIFTVFIMVPPSWFYQAQTGGSVGSVYNWAEWY